MFERNGRGGPCPLRVTDLFSSCRAMSCFTSRALPVYVMVILASAPSVHGQATIPNTPAGQALRAFLDAFNSPDSTRVTAFLSTYQVGFPFRNLFNFRR